MTKRLWLFLLAALALSGISAQAQTDAFNGFCNSGGRSAVVSGLSSTNKLQQVIPSCTVTVYLTGTTTKATIFKDGLNTPLSNPFTAAALTSTAPGQWLFYAATGQGYDVVMSGGIAPLTFPSPVTLTDLKAGGGGGGGGACTGNFPSIAYLTGTNICAGDPLFSDLGNGLGVNGGLKYIGNGALFDAENSGSYTFIAADPNVVNGSANAQFNLSSGGVGSATFGVNLDTSAGGTNSGNINLFTSGSSTNGNNIFLTAISSPSHGGSGNITLEGSGDLIKADVSNITLQATSGINLISGTQPTTFRGGIAPKTTLVTTTPYTIPGVGETTTLYNASGGNIVATLPGTGSLTDGIIFIQKKVDSSSNTVTVTPSGGAIDGGGTFVLSFQYQWVALQYDANIGDWHVFATGPAYTGALTPNDCVQVNATGNGFVDSGAGCGGGGGGGAAFNAITSGSNITAAMVVGTGASLAPAGSGTIAATSVGGITVSGTPSTGQVLTATSTSAANWQSAPASPSFSVLTSGTNTGAAMLVGTGASLGVSGSGTIAATSAVALAATPSVCSTGQYASGVDINGDAICVPLPTQPASQYIAPQAMSGCGVEYVSGLSYTVGACTYSINGVIYDSPLTNVTLAAADPTNPRFDVIFVDTTQTVNVIQGVAAASPQLPVVDPSTQLQLTFVLVPAAATTPADTTLVDIYLEGVEWTGAKGGTNGSRVNLTSTSNPYSGTHDTEFGVGGTVTTTTFAGYTVPSAGTVNLSNYNTLTFYMRNKAAWPATRSIIIQWFNGTTQKGTGIVISDGAFGWNATTNTTTYQQISIPTSIFGLAGVPVTSVRFTVSGTGAALTGFYLDQITLQGGSGGPSLPATLMNFKGPWSSTATYNPNDTVTSGGVGYVALLTNTNVAVTTVSTWSPLGGSGGSLASFAAPSASWPTWLVPTVTNGSGPNASLAVAANAIPYSALAGIGANTVLGALTATIPSALAMPSCSTAGSSALIWTSGVGFGCNSISGGGGGGNTTSTSLTNNFLPKANGVNSIIDSKLSDDGTSLTYAGSGTVGSFGLNEGTAGTGVTGADIFVALASTHRWTMINNNGSALTLVGIASAGTANDCLKLAANGIDIVDTGAVCGSSIQNLPTPSISGPVKTVTDSNTAANHFFFNDGTDGWYAGVAYHSFGDFIDNTGPTMLANPNYFSSAQVLNEITKFLAAIDGTGRIPMAVGPNGAATAFCSSWDTHCAIATGDGIAILPQLAYLYYQKTGSTSAYSSIVAPWKTAIALVPRNGTTHLMTIVLGNEYVCGEGFEEYMRNSGDVTQCNVWYAWNTKIMSFLAGKAGDTTNQTFFNSEHTATLAGITAASLLDGGTGLFKAATGQNSANLDIYATALAVFCDSDPQVPCGVMSSGQKTTVSNYFVTNYASFVNSSGFVLNSPTDWAFAGTIDSSGGGGPSYSGSVPGSNQDGYWPRHMGWFLYTMGLTSPSQVATQMVTYLSGADTSAEYFTRTAPTVNAGTTFNLVSPIGANWIQDNQPAYLAYTDGASCVVNKFGACNPGATVGSWNGGTVTNPIVVSLPGSTTPPTPGLSVTQPGMTTGSAISMLFGKVSAPHSALFAVWRMTANPYGSLETFASGDPIQIGGSQVWLNGGSVFVGNSNANGGSTLPTATGLFNVGTTNQFSVDSSGVVHNPSVLASGIVDGTAPMTITTGTTATLGGTYKSGYTFNQEATAATAVAYTLPTAAAGLQYCIGNSWNGSAATTGVLTLNTSASGQFIIFTDGTLTATGGNITSGGAAADAVCVVGVDSTHWQLYTQRGVWTKH